jgi:uncharacterized membrane protein
VAAVIAIVFADDASASDATDDVHHLSGDLGVGPGGVARIARTVDGAYRVVTTHQADEGGGSWAMLWPLFFGLVFFVPVLGVTVGPDVAALLATIREAGIDGAFQDEVREMLSPGTSAVFVLAERAGTERAAAALRDLEGSLVTAPLTPDGERDLRRKLQGSVVGSS